MLHNWFFWREEQNKMRGLLKSKSSEERHEMEKKLVPNSKSCNTGVAPYLMSSKNKSSSLILKTVPTAVKKSTTPRDQQRLKVPSAFRIFKTSFSNDDICKSWSSPNFTSHISQSHVQVNSKNLGVSSSRVHDLGKNPHSVSDLLTIAAESSKDLSAISLHNGSGFYENGQTNNLILCKLCLMMIPQGELYQLEGCGCLFCEMCLQQYLTVNIQDGNVVITCPDGECRKAAKILVSEVEKFVNPAVYEQFKRFKLNREVELDPTRTWCPGINCETICYVRPTVKGEESVAVSCSKCGFTFCSVCKEKWHPSKTCDEMKKNTRDEEDLLLVDVKNSSIKRCPSCHVLIERDEGCAQMMCKRCKHVFCWYCLTSLDDDFLLRHYDKGPCKNKLGHTRASVVWHRTQVVCIFAGFGFLLLVASPLLLLGAPCFLCCQCKRCQLIDKSATV